MESLFCLQLKFFWYANEPNDDVLDSPLNFCMSCSVGRSKGIPTSAGWWHNGTSFSPARLLHLIKLVCVRDL